MQRTKEKYEAALQEINSYNPKYMEDMNEVFEKCQQMETQRLVFFKDVLFNIHKGVNISQDPMWVLPPCEWDLVKVTYLSFFLFFFFFCCVCGHRSLPQIYEELYHTVNNADHDKDLKWWSFNYGVNMGMNWPQFEVQLYIFIIFFTVSTILIVFFNLVFFCARVNVLCYFVLILFWLHVVVWIFKDYSEEFRDIGGVKGKGKAQLPEGGIALINQRIVTDDLPVNFLIK